LSPIIPFLYRQADRNDVIPLSSPIMTESGQVISEIPISKGQDIIISIGGYNRYGQLCTLTAVVHLSLYCKAYQCLG